MSGETDEREDTNESEAKPTITIAEREARDNETSEAKPTITIAERDGGE